MNCRRNNRKGNNAGNSEDFEDDLEDEDERGLLEEGPATNVDQDEAVI